MAITRLDKVTNDYVRVELEVENILEYVKRRQLKDVPNQQFYI